MGAADENDSLDFSDGWNEEDAHRVTQLSGTDLLSCWEDAESIYKEAGAKVQVLLIAGVGYDRKALQQYSTEFFKKVLNGE